MSSTPPPEPPPGGYGSPPQGGFAQPGFGYGPPAYGPSGYGGYGGGTSEHPQGTTILVLGICSLVFTFVCGFGVFLGPVAWIMGNNALREIDANPSVYSNRGSVSAGRICGIIASALIVVMVVGVVILFAIAAGSSSSN